MHHPFTESCPPKRVEDLLETITEELFERRAEKRRMLHACLQQLFLFVYQLWQKAEAEGSVPDKKSLVHFRKFKQRIREMGTGRNVTQLASAHYACTPAPDLQSHYR